MNVLQKLIPVVVSLLVFSGCAATSQSNTPLVSQLQMRVGELERDVDTREARIRQMESAIKDLTHEIDQMKRRGGSYAQSRSSEDGSLGSPAKGDDKNIVRVPVGVDKVQVALKNAGYYKGEVDGKIGKETRSAISRFQTDRGLKADGVIGRKTWDELKTHLE
jgi:murein L,D-transpeptidase YcbB/YkuD